jgi:hypothetical protein
MWAEIDPDEYARRFPASARAHRSPAHKAARHAAIAIAWLAALGAGAWSARWVDQNGGIEATLRNVLPAPQRPPRPVDALADRGAGAGETALKPARVLSGPVPEAVAPTGTVAPESRIARRETGGRDGSGQDIKADVASRGQISSGSGGEVGMAAQQAQQAHEAGAKESRPAAVAPKPRAKTARTADKAVKAKPSDTSEDRTARAAKKPSSSAASASQKVARGREISRIQAQAAEELKKKRPDDDSQ